MRPAVASRQSAVVVALVGVAGLLPARLAAQVVRQDTIRLDSAALRQRRDSLRLDSLRQDSVRGRVVPRTPSRRFPEPDSVIRALLEREGFLVTRYAGDSVQLQASEEKKILIRGSALLDRAGSTLEADSVTYVERTCALTATGMPRLFDSSGTLMGEGMVYDACNKTGMVMNATTDLQHGGGTWVVRGDIAVDNVEGRTYAAGAEISSCTLVEPHYHFEARQVKWVNKRLMLARPAVLYVADVPVVWLPFVFQDTRRGRRSGVLPPQFGVNDIVRFNSGYQRHITNVGYYLAINDFMDAQASMDWYASRYTALNGRFRYRWLNRFLAGGVAVQQLREHDGSTSSRLSWSHQQQFSLNSQLTANLDYASSSRVISRNAVDPILAVGTIDSRLNYQRRSSIGMLNLGGSRTQSLDKPQVSVTFPTLAFTPNPIPVSRSVTWSPSLTFTNNLLQKVGPGTLLTRPGRAPDTLLTNSRNTSVSLSSPVRIGSWTLSNSFSLRDEWNNRRTLDTIYDPTDSTRFTVRTFAEGFQTGVDWSVGFGLPVLFQGRWNVQPGVQLVNTTGGDYALRNQFTGGRYVTQGKRAQFNAGVSPTLFGLFPGIGPVTRIRHAVSPSLSWAYSPSATVDSAFARALAQGRTPATLRIPARQSISLGLSQNFEGKLRPVRAAPVRGARPPASGFPGGPAPQLDSMARDSLARDSLGGQDSVAAETLGADTTGGGETAEGRKIKLLSIQSDAISYDFEQAKEPGRTGWTTQLWGNTLSSDLVRGFSLRIAHDLWNGPVGTDSARFDPFLTSVAMNFSVSSGTFGFLGRLFGLRRREAPILAQAPPDSAAADSLRTQNPTDPGRNFSNAFARGPLASQFSTVDRLGQRSGAGFTANLNFSLQRPRPLATAAPATPGVVTPAAGSPTNSMLSGSVQFSPTRNWNVSWQTSYNFTQGTFTDHVVRLDRDLHDWRATFTFVRSPNGNFLFNFYIELIAEPDLKFQYDQRNTGQ